MPEYSADLFDDDDEYANARGAASFSSAKEVAANQHIDPLPPITPGTSVLKAVGLGTASGATFGRPEQLGNPFSLDPRPFVRVNALTEAVKPEVQQRVDSIKRQVQDARAEQPAGFIAGEVLGGTAAPSLPVPGKGVLPAAARVAVGAGEAATYAANTGGDPGTAAMAGGAAGVLGTLARALGLGRAQKIVAKADEQAELVSKATAAKAAADEATEIAKKAAANKSASAKALEERAADLVKQAKEAAKLAKPTGQPNKGAQKLMARGAAAGLVGGGAVQAVMDAKEIVEDPKRALVPVGLGLAAGLVGKGKGGSGGRTARAVTKVAPVVTPVAKSASRAVSSRVTEAEEEPVTYSADLFE